MARIFRDREDAGRELGRRLRALDVRGDLLVLGLPRGGVPVACEVAAALAAPVDVLVVRKLGAPLNHELAVGAIAYGGVTVYNDAMLEMSNLTEQDLEPTRRAELVELKRRERAYRGGGAPLTVTNKTVILVDDGVATGATMHAAVLATRRLQAQRIIVAAPTGASDSLARLKNIADQVVVLETPEPYYAVGAWYAAFPQLRDEEVVACLAAARSSAAAPGVRSPAQALRS